MKEIHIYPVKNSIREIKTWESSNGEVLSSITHFRDGCFQVWFPESEAEEREMLEQLYAEPEGKHYSQAITENSENIDLSDYVHDVVELGVSSSEWFVKRGDDDVSSEFSSLLNQLEALDNYDSDEFLEENEWEIDLQYFEVGSIRKLEEVA